MPLKLMAVLKLYPVVLAISVGVLYPVALLPFPELSHQLLTLHQSVEQLVPLHARSQSSLSANKNGDAVATLLYHPVPVLFIAATLKSYILLFVMPVRVNDVEDDTPSFIVAQRDQTESLYCMI